MARKTKYGIGGTRVEIEGDEELIRKLNAMSKGFRSKALLHALTQGAEIIEREAKARAPVRTGLLRRAITTITLKSGNKLAKVAVGWRNSKASRFAAFYGIMQEKGTKPRRTKAGVRTGTGPARPFLIPAFDSKREQVARQIKIELSRLIRRAVKKGL